MTESNFIALHFPAGQENIAGTLHLNVNQVGETQQGIISSLIIHVNAFSINGNENDTATYIENVLEQIESVKFTFLGISYELIIISRAYYPAQNPFFYYTVEPAYVPNIFLAEQFTASVEDVVLTPYLLDVQFGFSEFNPLISNASVGRKSKRIMQSDRLEQTILPANITALLSESAEKASIQDSLYTDTGWSNARYVGSETSAAESAGIPPMLAGRTFTGEVFSATSDTEYICGLNSRLNQQLFHTSDSELPAFELSDITFELAEEFGQQQTILEYTQFPESGSIDIGDVLQTFAYEEYLKVRQINTQLKQITVERDIYGKYFSYLLRPNPYPAGITVSKVKRFDIFRFENTGQNRIQLVNNSRIYVNENNTIIDTDDYGQITSSSICPAPGYLVD